MTTRIWRCSGAAMAFVYTLGSGSTAQAAQDAASGNTTYAVAAAAFALGLGILGAGLGQGRAAAAAYEGICRNPAAADKVFTPMIIGLAMLESLVILGFITCFVVLSTLGG